MGANIYFGHNAKTSLAPEVAEALIQLEKAINNHS